MCCCGCGLAQLAAEQADAAAANAVPDRNTVPVALPAAPARTPGWEAMKQTMRRLGAAAFLLSEQPERPAGA